MQLSDKSDTRYRTSFSTCIFRMFTGLLFCFLLASCSDGGGSDPASIDQGDSGGLITAPVPGDDGQSPTTLPEGGQTSGVGTIIPDTPSAAFYATNSSSNILAGAVIGDNTYSGEEQSRPLPFQIDSVNASVTLESVMAVRSDFFGEQSTTLIITLFNGTDQPSCSVSIEQHKMIDVDGNEIESILPFALLVGTNYATPGSDLVVDCLPSGERAYMVTSYDVDFDRAGQLSVETLEDRDARGEANVSISVIPTQYTLVSEGRLMNLTIQNQGAGTVELSSLLSVILDATGRPVFAAYSFFEQNLSGDLGIELAPGEETIDTVVIIGFRGQGSSVRTIVNGRRVP